MTSNAIRLAPNPIHDGDDEQPTERCRRCAGVGRIAMPVATRVFIAERCPACQGEGVVPYWQEARR